ncbi:ATP-binding protein [Streptomyces albus]|uniref:sensor histidine kinase n=1 Tax=Streptomyces albus TaxID=1888 RepID=UPI0013B47FC2|nr:HAMP domain-containing sensor histidine kinase [Streptomyces albus]QID39108.1 ATP-binding protein [Streptomyces albus]
MARPSSSVVRTPNGIGTSASESAPDQDPSRTPAGPADETARGARRPAHRRHGKPRPRETTGDAAVRRRLVRLAALPAGLTALTGAVVSGCLLADRDSARPPGATTWAALVVGLLVSTAVVTAAAVLAAAEARGSAERCAALRRATTRGQAELDSMLWTLRHGERPVPRTHARPRPSRCGAEAAVAEAAALAGQGHDGGQEADQEHAAVLGNLARRLQTLAHREIRLIDELEHDIDDPDLLERVFAVDHLATRVRRHAENLAVLGGAAPHRRWNRPVHLSEVLRSAVAEIEQYPRVQLVPPVEGAVRGHAVTDIVHLLAELVENATVFSAPETQVLVRAQRVTAGIAVEIEDRGFGMSPGDRHHMNAVLTEPDRVDFPALVRDGRIGLYLVAALARRHGIVVQLRDNIYGGVQAVIVLPRRLLAADDRSGASGTAPGEATGTAARSATGTAAAAGGVTAAAPGGHASPDPASGSALDPASGPDPAPGPPGRGPVGFGPHPARPLVTGPTAPSLHPGLPPPRGRRQTRTPRPARTRCRTRGPAPGRPRTGHVAGPPSRPGSRVRGRPAARSRHRPPIRTRKTRPSVPAPVRATPVAWPAAPTPWPATSTRGPVTGTPRPVTPTLRPATRTYRPAIARCRAVRRRRRAVPGACRLRARSRGPAGTAPGRGPGRRGEPGPAPVAPGDPRPRTRARAEGRGPAVPAPFGGAPTGEAATAAGPEHGAARPPLPRRYPSERAVPRREQAPDGAREVRPPRLMASFRRSGSAVRGSGHPSDGEGSSAR